MTDRIHSITIILQHDLRIDDAQGLIDAVRWLRGVIEVKPNVTEGLADIVAESRVRREVQQKLFDALK